jgi:plastocyanin
VSERRARESLLLPILIPVGGLAVIVTVLFLFSRVLLAIKPNAATATALATAVGIMAVAAFVASRAHVTGAALGGFLGAAAGIAMVAGGIAIAVIGPPELEVEPFHAELAAPEDAIDAGFATTEGQPTDTLVFEANAPVELEFKNDDPGLGHNVEIFDGPDASAPSLFDGAPITGPAETVYHIEPLAPGEYFFHCRLHPDTAMAGTITVEKGAGSIQVVAKNTAFDVDEIQLPADAPSRITLDNQDPTEHNLSIYQDDSASGEPLLQFEPFVGPATKTVDVEPLAEGEYFFRCDVHPTMSGRVVVRPGPPPPPPEGGG